jgi:hypothetical protein
MKTPFDELMDTDESFRKYINKTIDISVYRKAVETQETTTEWRLLWLLADAYNTGRESVIKPVRDAVQACANIPVQIKLKGED